jgi:hypothetical protein
MTTAVVFVLSQYLMPDAERCITYCLARGYDMIGVIKDDWDAAFGMLVAGTVTVVVAADPHHVDPGRTPRVEYVAHVGPQGQHRPRLIE